MYYFAIFGRFFRVLLEDNSVVGLPRKRLAIVVIPLDDKI
jgi:hypothetical protein